MISKDFILYTKTIDLSKWVFRKVLSFPKKQRFVLGQQIENSIIMCVRLVVEANDINGKSAKLRKLNALNIELDVLRTLLRVAFEFGFMSGKSLAFGIKNIDDVGRSVGAWIQSCSAEPSSKGE